MICFAGQGLQAGAQAGLVAFDADHQVRAAVAQVGDVRGLAVERVGGDHDIVQVADPVQDRGQARDFVGLGVHVDLREDDRGGVVDDGEQVHRVGPAQGGAHGLAVDGQYPPSVVVEPVGPVRLPGQASV